jgi:hypothetical protein
VRCRSGYTPTARRGAGTVASSASASGAFAPVAERLVEQQHARIDRERAHQRRPLAPAAGELRGMAARERLELQQRQQRRHRERHDEIVLVTEGLDVERNRVGLPADTRRTSPSAPLYGSTP